MKLIFPDFLSLECIQIVHVHLFLFYESIVLLRFFFKEKKYDRKMVIM